MTPTCLVIPPSPFLLDERVFVSLGILKVASSLLAAGRDVEVLDLSGISNFEDAARSHFATSSATTFGVTATTPQMPAAKKLLTVLRQVRPEARAVLGGPHATLALAATKRERSKGRRARGHNALERLCNDWDQLVAGDGEVAMVRLLDGLDSKIVDADDPVSDMFLKRGSLDELPMPARHLVDLGSYKYQIDGHRATSLIAQLGCPFKCAFCAGRNSAFLRRVRTRSAASVVAEVEHIHSVYGYTAAMMYDDELNVNKEMLGLMAGLRALQDRLGVEMRFRGFVKSELFTKEQAEAMVAAGFRWILCGYESGSPRVLTNIEKMATREDNTRCVELARAAGLKVKALMSIGHAGESAATCRETEEWLMEVRPDDFDVAVITPYPGSPYYDDSEESAPGVWTFKSPRTGDALHSQEVDYNVTADYYKGVPGDYVAYVSTEHMTGADLVAERDAIEGRVRAALGIPWNQSSAALRYEHSMGQGLPENVLRRAAGESQRARLPVVA